MKKKSKTAILPAAEQRVRIEYMPLDELLRFPKNPKGHDLGSLGEAFEHQGFVTPLLMDERSGLLVEGHGRLEKLQELKAAGAKPPARIDVAPSGAWYAPVVRGVGFDNLDQARRHLLGANRIGEGLWDNRLTAEMLGKLGEDGLSGTGFGDGDLAMFLTKAGHEPRVGNTDPDDLPDLPKKPRTKIGDLWLLGDHRLLCGETTDPAVVRRVVGGQAIAVLHGDPPYGMGKEADGIDNDNLYDEKLDDFQMKWWAAWSSALVANGSVYIWGNAPDLWRLWWRRLSTKENGLLVRNEIVWDKGSGFGMRSSGAHSYPPATERCLFLMRGQQFLGNQNKDDFWEGYEPLRSWLEKQRLQAKWTNTDVNRMTNTQMAGHWFSRSQFIAIPREHYETLAAAAKGKAFAEKYDDLFTRVFPDLKSGGNAHRRELSAVLRDSRSWFDNTHDAMTDVWQFPRVHGEERFGHATPKPVAMAARAVKSSCPPAGVVGVPFCGTGPEFIAAEQLERRCVGVDNSPAYCDVVVERWQNFTGKKARLQKG